MKTENETLEPQVGLVISAGETWAFAVKDAESVEVRVDL
jgi:hypothetical protein